MKATEQYFLEVLFISMYFTVVRFISCTKLFLLLRLWMKRWSLTVQMKATEQYFPVQLFITLYKDRSNFWVCQVCWRNL